MRSCRYEGRVVPAPQIRFHGFWRYINVCMYVCTLCMSRDHKAQEIAERPRLRRGPRCGNLHRSPNPLATLGPEIFRLHAGDSLESSRIYVIHTSDADATVLSGWAGGVNWVYIG